MTPRPHTQETAAAPRVGHDRSATQGLMHRDHPWMGRDVEDTATGRRGILRAIAPDIDRPRPVAWPMPAGGGTEWTTLLSAPPSLMRREPFRHSAASGPAWVSRCCSSD